MTKGSSCEIGFLVGIGFDLTKYGVGFLTLCFKIFFVRNCIWLDGGLLIFLAFLTFCAARIPSKKMTSAARRAVRDLLFLLSCA